MDDNEDFFFNATLSCYKTTKLFNYSSGRIKKYESDLNRSLGVNIPSSVEFVQVEWKTESRVFNQNSVEFSFLYIQCRDALYRICFIVWPKGSVLLANCAPPVLTPCINWISTQFDCVVDTLKLSPQVLVQEFNRYVHSALEGRSVVTSSEFIFDVSRVLDNNDLNKLTIQLPGHDIEAFYNQNRDNILTPLYQHLQTHTALDCNKLTLSRINCGGFIMTSTGKFKLFKQTLDTVQMWDTVAHLLLAAQTT